jgi:hypothetical protein
VKVLFYCGLAPCENTGTIDVASDAYRAGTLTFTCPACGRILKSREHFELLDDLALQRERQEIAAKPGPMTDEDRDRIREIHRLLGHEPVREFSKERDSLVMKVASTVMQRLRNEEKN